MIDPAVFKTNDVRGFYPDALDEDGMYKIGKYTAKILNAKKVFVARDARNGSESLRDALVCALTEMGCEVDDGGLTDSCVFYYAAYKGVYDASFMITASHNPREYNGVKIVKSGAHFITMDSELAAVKDLVLADESVTSDFAVNGLVRTRSYDLEYLEYVCSKVPISEIKRMKVVLDASHGAASLFAARLFSRLPIELELLNFDLNGNFPNHPSNPLLEESSDELKRRVVSGGAKLGILFDGDGDRVVFCDENGKMIRSDMMASILARSVISDFPGAAIVCDGYASDFVSEVVSDLGGKFCTSAVGHASIVEKMRCESAPFGAEISGHIYYKDGDFLAENSWLAVLQVIHYLSTEDVSISSLLKGSEKYVSLHGKNFEGVDGDICIEKVKAAFAGLGGEIDEVDGLSIRFDDWRFNLRKSNTEPLVRLMAEARSQELLDEKVALLVGVIEMNYSKA